MLRPFQENGLRREPVTSVSDITLGKATFNNFTTLDSSAEKVRPCRSPLSERKNREWGGHLGPGDPVRSENMAARGTHDPAAGD